MDEKRGIGGKTMPLFSRMAVYKSQLCAGQKDEVVVTTDVQASCYSETCEEQCSVALLCLGLA